jgi:hypothetical protein
MHWFFRFSLCALLTASLAATVSYVEPDWLADLNLDFWRLPQYEGALQREHQRGENLKELYRAVLARMEAKNAVGQNLVAGRITLAEATHRFRELCAQAPRVLDSIYLSEHGRTNAERLCRHTIGWVKSTLTDRPREARELGRRLEAELESYLDRYGTVPLPPESS